ncbi:hypothetical protein IV203_018595 [Nitzschia inconspicua]|uniref:Right handed beta helix domain-containing protein n=1 Tax=Nitzschia inconspicua TaxID=303405 RepID=A0A9K3M1Z3_9STRA|nr:hypothetical protein IV203_018595 [Nitzschia inconspicua]
MAQVSAVTDLAAYIGSQLAMGQTYIKIPEGVHYVDPKARNGRVGLLLENLNGVTIDGTNAEMILTKTTRAIEINNCNDLTLIGLAIDYDPLPFMQGFITDMTDDKLELTVQLMKGYPEAGTFTGDKVEIYSPVDDELTTQTYYGASFTPLASDKIKVTKQKTQQVETSFEEVGDIVVIGSTTAEQTIPHAIRPDKCNNLVFKDVKVYASNSFGFLETDCNASRYINCSVDRRPVNTDLKSRGYRRLRSTTTDGFHSKHARVGPSYIGCTARYNGDDGIAINGHYHIVSRVERGNKLRVIGKLGEVPNLKVGDEAELMTYRGVRLPNAKIVAFDPNAGVALDSSDQAFLNNQEFIGNVQKTRSFATHAYYVTLDRSVNLPTGSLIASSNRVGNGFEVRDCTIGPTRSRGILVKASDGIISNNVVVDTWGHGIMAAPVYGWLEAGSSNNLTIRGNVIRRCRDVGIAVLAFGGDGSCAPAGAHSNVTITRNLITASARPAIAVTSTKNLKENNNRIEGQRNYYLLPKNMGDFDRAADPNQKIYLKNTIRAL